jgi:hypothetical protein
MALAVKRCNFLKNSCLLPFTCTLPVNDRRILRTYFCMAASNSKLGAACILGRNHLTNFPTAPDALDNLLASSPTKFLKYPFP